MSSKVITFVGSSLKPCAIDEPVIKELPENVTLLVPYAAFSIREAISFKLYDSVKLALSDKARGANIIKVSGSYCAVIRGGSKYFDLTKRSLFGATYGHRIDPDECEMNAGGELSRLIAKNSTKFSHSIVYAPPVDVFKVLVAMAASEDTKYVLVRAIAKVNVQVSCRRPASSISKQMADAVMDRFTNEQLPRLNKLAEERFGGESDDLRMHAVEYIKEKLTEVFGIIVTTTELLQGFASPYAANYGSPTSWLNGIALTELKAMLTVALAHFM